MWQGKKERNNASVEVVFKKFSALHNVIRCGKGRKTASVEGVLKKCFALQSVFSNQSVFMMWDKTLYLLEIYPI